MSTSHVLQRNKDKDGDDGSETDNLQTVLQTSIVMNLCINIHFSIL